MSGKWNEFLQTSAGKKFLRDRVIEGISDVVPDIPGPVLPDDYEPKPGVGIGLGFRGNEAWVMDPSDPTNPGKDIYLGEVASPDELSAKIALINARMQLGQEYSDLLVGIPKEIINLL